MRLYLGHGYTYSADGAARCEECNRTSPTMATITFDDDIGGGGTYCKVHSLNLTRADLGKDTVHEVMELWNRAEGLARIAKPWPEWAKDVEAVIGGTHAATVSKV